MPTVLITGGTGLIGKSLTTKLTAKGYDVIIMSRNPPISSNNPKVTYAVWNIEKQKIDSSAIATADYVVNLAGAGVLKKRWTKEYKRIIIESRTQSSDLLIKALKENNNHVKAVIAASAIGYYGEDPKPLNNKNVFIETGAADENFLGDTCRIWEQSIEPVIKLDKRLVKLRTGMVLTNDGGVLLEFKKPLRFGIAAILGSGKQMISWIHIDDLCRIYINAIENEQLSGTYNAVAPLPVSNKKLMLNLAARIRGQFYIPVHIPKFLLKLVLGEGSIEVLKSTTVSSEKIKTTGFTFLYPTIDSALKELCKKD